MKIPSFRSPLGRLQWTGDVEALSFLVLLLIAMPMKYIGGNPYPVQVVGMVHGVLFMVYILALIQASIAYKWSIKVLVLGFCAAIIPFGPIIADKRLYRVDEV